MFKKGFASVQKAFHSFLAKIEAKWAIKVAIAAAVSFSIGSWYGGFFETTGPAKLISGLWCAISSIIVSQARLGGSYKNGWIRFFGTGTGAAMGGFFTYLLGANPLSLALSIAFTVMFLSLLDLKPAISLTSVTVALVMILWKISPTRGPWAFAFFRFLDACIGISVALLVSFLIWPQKASSKMHVNMADILASISQFFREMMILKGEAETRAQRGDAHFSSIEEKLKKNLLYLEEAKLEMIFNKRKMENWLAMHQKCSVITDLIYSLRFLDKSSLDKVEEKEVAESLGQANEHLHFALQESTLSLRTVSTVKQNFDLRGCLQKLDRVVEKIKSDSFPPLFIGNFFVFFYFYREIAEEIENVIKLINYLKE